ncbi:hypothetical protein [Micromonospora soli]|uniref:hypothetical protein n=1 Tax=Micromonospora sp. NBRC 110009 TaxID=3061627 RepID=UPI0034A01108
MKVDDLRGQLRRRGVSGISALRKPELVKTLARTLRAESRGGGAARRATGPAGRPAATKKAAAKKAPAKRAAAAKAAPTAKATGARAKKAAPAKRAPAKKAPAARKTVAAKKAPAARKTAAAKKAPAARKTAAAKRVPAAKRAPAAKKAPAAKRAPAAKKAPAAKRAVPARKAAAAKAAPARGAGTAAAPATGIRGGRSSSRSVLSSQQITSLADRPERPGRSLVTANHEVIQRWARARGARPATIAGTEREGRAGVLTFNIPGYRESSRIREISWDDWFRTFDLRGLNLIYQEQMRDGRQSNFFRTENPNREDG